MPRRYVERDGVRLAYLDAGEGSATVLLHGLCDRADTWAPLELPGRTVALDARGHGESSWGAGFAFGDLVDDVVAVMDALDLSHVDLVGHSMGAIVAYLVAVAVPDRISRLVLEEPGLPLPQTPPRDEGPRPDEDLDYDWGIEAPFSAQRNHPDPAWYDGLASITAPTLVVLGTRSPLLAEGTAVAERIPGARSVRIEAGHEVHAEQPQAFRSLVCEFLA